MAYKRHKPMPNEKVERNAELYEYRTKHPKERFIDIGKKFGISGPAACIICKQITRRKVLELARAAAQTENQ